LEIGLFLCLIVLEKLVDGVELFVFAAEILAQDFFDFTANYFGVVTSFEWGILFGLGMESLRLQGRSYVWHLMELQMCI